MTNIAVMLKYDYPSLDYYIMCMCGSYKFNAGPILEYSHDGVYVIIVIYMRHDMWSLQEEASIQYLSSLRNMRRSY